MKNLLAAICLLTACSVEAATYNVTGSGDANSEGTLRYAINQANGNVGADRITFDLPAPHVISPTGTLPWVTDAVTIDGSSQSGFSGVPLVCIHGGGVRDDGLFLSSASCTVRCLRISGFVSRGVSLYFTSNCVVQGCDIMSNGTFGFWIYDSPNNLIGGTAASNRNVVSGNAGSGIYLHHNLTTNNVIAGNYIGTTRDGRSASTNGYGVSVVSCADNTIGGSNAGSKNVISGNLYGINLNNGADNNVVVGNYIGTDLTGTNALPNTTSGINVYGAENRIGGATAAERNIISGNSQYGLYLRNTAAVENVIIGNYIGVDATGSKGIPNGDGIYGSEAPMNFIGGTITGERNIISGNSRYAIYLTQTSHSYVIRGNYIGVDASGGAALTNLLGGLRVVSPSNVIGGVGAGARNIISASASHGIWLEDEARYTVIQGNYIGTDATGSNAIPNGTGIGVDSAHNQIGGVAMEMRNVVSGNDNHGISLSSSAVSNSICGNYVGVDVSGQLALPNFTGMEVTSPFNEIGAVGGGNVISGNERTGLSITGSGAHHNRVRCNTVGLAADGMTPVSNELYGISLFETSSNEVGIVGEGNVISGNDIGMRIFGNLAVCVGNTVAGNFIGTDRTGSNAVGNRIGLHLAGTYRNRVGTSTNVLSNLISGNRDYGLFMQDSTGNVVQANYIGTDVTGRRALGNGSDGVWLGTRCQGNTIGGATNGNGNIICGNGESGVTIYSSESRENLVLGNWIGLGAGTNDVGNGLAGVRLASESSFNWVGGRSFWGSPANRIAYNKGAGVLVESTCVSNPILLNSIFENRGLGIDLGNDGVTPNDEKDPDTGANLLQNFVEITVMTNSGGWMYFQGHLNSRSLRSYHLEFFANQKCDVSGYGEGEFFLGEADNLLTDANGDAWFTNAFPRPIPPANYITMTVTDQSSYDTSEYCLRVFNDSDGDGMGDGYEFIHWGTETSGVATADSDGDGVNDLDEFLADTNPQDPDSRLAFSSIQKVSGGYELRIESTSVDRYYDIQYAWTTNLVNPSSWSDALWNRQGVSGTMILTNTTGVENRYYRVRTEAP